MAADDLISIMNAALTDIYKTKFLDLFSAAISRKHIIRSLIPVDPTVTGKVQSHGILFSDVTGFASGGIPEAGTYTAKQTNYLMKEQYFRARIDRKSMMLSKDPSGAFKEQFALTMASGKETIERELERMLIQSDGTGALGTVSSVVDNGGGSYSVVYTAATWVRTNHRIDDKVNFGTKASVFRVTSVVRESRKVNYILSSGSDAPGIGDVAYRQSSKDKEIMGIAGIVKAADGSSLYGITVGDGWRSLKHDAADKPITEDMMIDMLLNIEEECGEMPDSIIVSPVQRKKLYELARGKVLNIVERDVSQGEVPLGAIPHLNVGGKEVKLLTSFDMVASDMFFVNFSKLRFRTVGSGTFIPGNNGLMHYEGISGNLDVYSVVWAQYSELFGHPSYHGVIYNLGVNTPIAI